MGRIVQLVQHMPAPVGIRPFKPASSLLQGLRAYWKLDETSGTRADVSGNALTLADNNTVLSAAGKISNAAQFVAANTEWLSRSDDPLLSFTASYTISSWVYFDSLPGVGLYRPITAKDSGVSPNREFFTALTYAGGANYIWNLSHYEGGTTVKIANRLQPASTATWYHFLAWYDSSLSTLNVSVDNGTISTTAGVAVGANTTAQFLIGRTGFGAGQYMDGRIDEVCMWARVLTTAERTQLYNGGAGVTYPQFS